MKPVSSRSSQQKIQCSSAAAIANIRLFQERMECGKMRLIAVHRQPGFSLTFDFFCLLSAQY
jgi:hypothetical protein